MMKTTLLLMMMLTGPVLCVAQGGTVTGSTAQAPSSLLQPALDSVAAAGSGVTLNRWKGSNAARDEVDGNLMSMQKDLQTTLPPLLTAADAAPQSASASLPVLLNLDALYSVLLRVTIASRTGAPREENVALERAAALLDSARRDLGDAILQAAKDQEKRIADLEAKAQQPQSTQVIPEPSAPPTSTPTAIKSKKKAAKTSSKQ